MRVLLVVLALFTLSAAPSCWRNGWIEVGGDGGQVQGIGRAAAFAPFAHGPQSVGFVYGRAALEGNCNYEGDIGVGYRALCGCVAMGMYGFYDIRRTHHHHLYHEVTLGADLYLPQWEARVNGYIPIWGHNNHGLRQSVRIENDTPILIQTLEGSLFGLNVETGPHLFLCGGRCGCPEVRALVGGYFFKRSGVQSIGGYRARIEASSNLFPCFLRAVRFTVGATFQKDRIQAGNWFLYGRLSIPLNTICRRGRSCNPCPRDPCSFLYHRVDRMDMMAIDRRTQDPTEIFFKGRLVERIITVNAATPDVAAAATTAGENSLVIVDGPIMLNASITQPQGQTIAGGGSLLPITVPGENAVTTLLPGAPGVLSNIAPLTLVDMSQNGTIFGLGLTGDAPATGLVQMVNAPDAMLMESVVNATSGSTAVVIMSSDRASVMTTNFALNSGNGILITGGSDNNISQNNFTGTALTVVGTVDTVSTVIDTNQISSTTLASVGIGLTSPGLMNTSKDYLVTGNLVTASRPVVFDGFTDGVIRGNRLVANSIGIGITGNSGAPGARIAIERNTIPNAPQGMNFSATVVDVNDNTINGATAQVITTINSTLSGSGNTALPFSCVDAGGNSGSISFNNGANTCP